MGHDFSVVYDQVVANLLSGNDSVAAQELGTVPNWQAPSDAGYVPRSVSLSAQVKVFRRDRFTCRYCNSRTIFPPVLRLISVAFNGVFPYHPHGKMSQCHLAFWRDLASCDHLVPVARFGKSDEQNLVTACYMCNSMKQNWTVEELGWELQPISEDRQWDGLANRFQALLEFCEPRFEEARIPYFRNWLRALPGCTPRSRRERRGPREVEYGSRYLVL